MKLRGKIKWYHLLLAVLLLLAIGVEVFRPVPVDWSAGYAKDETKPYGTYVTFNELKKNYPQTEIETTIIPPYNTIREEDGNLVIITGTFSPGETDTRILLDFVARGNRVLIASEVFTGDFADTLNLATGRYWESHFHFNPFQDEADTQEVKFSDEAVSRDSFLIGSGPLATFESYDTLNSKVIAWHNDTTPLFIRTRFGNGEFFLHSAPQLFSNYQVLYGSPEPAFTALSYIAGTDHLIWDEYYKPGRKQQSNIFSFIKSQPALKYSYWLLLGIILVVVLVSFKRKYPALPVYTAPENSSVEFARTIGTLYFQQKNHTDLGHKMVKYFLSQLSGRFNISNPEFTDEFSKTISERSGIAKDEVSQFFSYLEKVNYSGNISQQELMELDKRIRNFNDKSLR